MSMLSEHIFMKLTYLMREYKNGEKHYQELLQEKMDHTNDNEVVSKEEIELFTEIIRFEDFLLEVLETFYEEEKIINTADICIYLVILYVICFKLSKMKEPNIEELALKNYPSKWHKVLRFFYQRNKLKLIESIGMKYLNADFCKYNICKQLQSKSECMKGLLKILNNNQIKINKRDTLKKGNVKTDMEKNYNKIKAYHTGTHKAMNFKEDDDEYTSLNSLPKNYGAGHEGSFCCKQGIKNLKERMNALSISREEFVQLNNDRLVKKTENHEDLLNTVYRKMNCRLNDKLFSNTKSKVRRGDVTSQKMHSNNKKCDDKQEGNGVIDEAKMQENTSTYFPSITSSASRNSIPEARNLLPEKNTNILSINLNAMQSRFPVLSNTTTKLREAAVIQKNEEEQLRIVQDVSKGGRDPLMWRKIQEELREKEKMEKKEGMEIKHLQALIWQEEAILAKRNVREKNRLEASILKNEIKERLNLKKMHIKQEIERKKIDARKQQQQKQEYLEDIDKFLRDYKQIRRNSSQSIQEIQKAKHPTCKEIIDLKKLLEVKRAHKILGCGI